MCVYLHVCLHVCVSTCVCVQVGLAKGLKARGNVEDWLGKVEEAMFSSLRRLSKASIADYQSRTREEWVVAGHPSQVHTHTHTYCYTPHRGKHT